MSLAAHRPLIDLEHKKLIIRVQCKISGLSRSSFYHKHCTESEENPTIISWLDKQYLDTLFFGTRKLLKQLQKQGYALNITKLKR